WTNRRRHPPRRPGSGHLLRHLGSKRIPPGLNKMGGGALDRGRPAGGAIVNLQTLVGVELPIIQAPMAGVQGSALAVAVSNRGGLGSLPCAMLSPDALRQELTVIRSQTARPFNVNFFCHAPPVPSTEREAAWRARLAPYYKEFGLDVNAITEGGGRTP